MNQPHRATIDAQGNIILPGAHAPGPQAEQTMEEGMWYSPEPAQEECTAEEKREPAPSFREVSWTVEETTNHVHTEVRSRVFDVAHDMLHEGAKQYRVSAHDAVSTGKHSMRATLSGIARLKTFLAQPVWIPGRKKKPVQYSRGALFMLDTVRFGGTFASIFVLLFVTLNYQSFWEIAQSYVRPIAQVTGMNFGEANEAEIAEKLKHIPALAVAGGTEGSLLDYLPPVGPPQNRLIIPALDLNVPIAVPPNDALLREDWKTLEEDIQKALEGGVAHYPGTARPGQAGNFFVTGHSSYFPWAPGAYKSVFARLHELKEGDEYWVFYNGDRHRYIIQSKKEIKPNDVSVLDQPIGKRISTLMTCTPVGTTLRRLILTAQEVDPVSGLALEVGEHGQEQLPKVRMDMLSI